MALDRQRIPGTALSWGSCSFLIGSERVFGFASISFENKLESSQLWGQSRAHGPRGHSRGKYVPGEVKVKVEEQTAVEIRKAIAALSSNGRTYGQVLFNCDYSGSEETSGQAFACQLEQCKYIGESVSHDEGTDLLFEEITVKPNRILRDDGLSIFDSAPEV